MKKTQIQRHQWINGLLKDPKAPDAVAYYADHVQLFEAHRLMQERDAEGMTEEQRESVKAYTATAWQAVWERYRYHTSGGSAYQKTTKSGKRKQISAKAWKSLGAKQKQGYERIVRNASGGTLEAGRLCEMFLAGRVAAIAGYHNPLTDKVLQPGISAARAAVAYELRRGLQQPLFEDFAAAEAWNERAWKIHREDMPDVAQNFDPERLPELEQIDAKMEELKSRITNYWQSRGSKRWKHAAAANIRLLEKYVASAYEGTVCYPKKDTAEYKALQRLTDIMHNTLIPSDLQDVTQEFNPRRKPMPQNTMRLWRSGGVSGWVDYPAKTTQVAAPQQLMDIPIPAIRTKTERSFRKNFAGMLLPQRVTKLVKGGIVG